MSQRFFQEASSASTSQFERGIDGSVPDDRDVGRRQVGLEVGVKRRIAVKHDFIAGGDRPVDVGDERRTASRRFLDDQFPLRLDEPLALKDAADLAGLSAAGGVLEERVQLVDGTENVPLDDELRRRDGEKKGD